MVITAAETSRLFSLCSKPSVALWSLVSIKSNEETHTVNQQNQLKGFFAFVILVSLVKEHLLNTDYFVPDTMLKEAKDGCDMVPFQGTQTRVRQTCTENSVNDSRVYLQMFYG